MTAAPTTDHDRLARITWSLIAEPSDPVALLAREVLGAGTALDLAREAGPAEAATALGARSDTEGRSIPAALDRWRARLAVVHPERTLETAERRGIRVVVPGDAEWPPLLDDLERATPHCLWACGPDSLAERTTGALSIALVGSRASTPYGEDTAVSIGGACAGRGATVVSGGAYGIDAAAHRGALAAVDGGGSGATIAILAGGLDALYPRGNTALLEEIRDRHLLLSEAPPGTAPTRWRFLARNRLIAALSRAVVVIEASWRSGALSTARHADDLSRPVGAVPGPITSAASAGCHRLVRERGAVLVTEPDEALDLLPGGPAAGDSHHAVQDELDLLEPSDRRVLDGIPPRSGIATDTLALDCALDPGAVTAALARLELLGLVVRRGQRVRRAR
ncbi:MAG: DNA-processing protein DprA [Brachybacterium sp.]|nr:DNA-processing protein DprA [Brachybacterium sp.]